LKGHRRIRKQCYELTAEDFERFPCWEFALDEEGRAGQDEATVRPIKLRGSVNAMGGPLLVLGVFSFPNGRIRLGQLTIGSGFDIKDTQPALFLGDRLLGFYLGALRPSKAESKAEIRELRAICDDSFPIYYSTALRDKRGQPLASGVLKGFYQYGGFDKPAKRLVPGQFKR
jgi:hypothetical protein